MRRNLATLPEDFFKGQNQLEEIQFEGLHSLGKQQRLPDGLFRGLTSLKTLDLNDNRLLGLPNLDDLTVRHV